MATIPLLDADGVEVAVQLPLAPGRGAAAASRPVALSTEDLDTLSRIEAGLADLLVAMEDGDFTSGTTLSRSLDVMSVMPAVIPTKGIISGATSGDNTILAAQGAGNKIVVHQLFLVSITAVTVRFESGAGGTALTGVMSMPATGILVLPYSDDGWFETAANALLNMELGGAVQVSGAYTYSIRT